MFFAVYALLLRYAPHDRPDPRLLVAAAVLFGMGLADHWLLMVLTAPGPLAVLVPVRKTMLRRLPLSAAVTAVTAAVPYA